MTSMFIFLPYFSYESSHNCYRSKGGSGTKILERMPFSTVVVYAFFDLRILVPRVLKSMGWSLFGKKNYSILGTIVWEVVLSIQKL